MKHILKPSLLLIVFLVLFSCEDTGLITICNDCYSEEPLSAKLNVKIDLSSYNNQVEISIYEGNIEDNILYKRFYSNRPESEIPVSINKKYTLTATYFLPGRNYTTVDSATPRVKYDKTTCDDPCFYVYDKTIDLRLKHTK